MISNKIISIFLLLISSIFLNGIIGVQAQVDSSSWTSSIELINQDQNGCFNGFNVNIALVYQDFTHDVQFSIEYIFDNNWGAAFPTESLITTLNGTGSYNHTFTYYFHNGYIPEKANIIYKIDGSTAEFRQIDVFDVNFHACEGSSLALEISASTDSVDTIQVQDTYNLSIKVNHINASGILNLEIIYRFYISAELYRVSHTDNVQLSEDGTYYFNDTFQALDTGNYDILTLITVKRNDNLVWDYYNSLFWFDPHNDTRTSQTDDTRTSQTENNTEETNFSLYSADILTVIIVLAITPIIRKVVQRKI